ncbi:MAG: M15 family metallopeptidase [Ignavibacteriaceae bacterium]|nr:M15 family metallopeptidase [Ignavibacteriaceae bacterium]
MNSSLRLYNVYGDPREKNGQRHLVLHNLINRISIFPARIYCSKDLVKPLEAALSLIIEKNLDEELRTYDGCYNLRPIRGLEKKYNSAISKNDITTQMQCLSAHCWGAAIDLDAAWNQLSKEPTINREVVKCFVFHGFEWGGNMSRKDGMHFQLIP